MTRGLFILFILSIIGCSKDGPGIGDTNDIFYLEDEFNVSLIERLGEQRQLDLRIETIKEDSCLNASLEYSYSFFADGQLHFIILNEINEPEDCDPGKTILEAQIPFTQAELGTYQIDINLLNEIKNSGQINIEEDFYELKMETDLGINVSYERLNKIPESILWGYIAYDSELLGPVAEDFIKDLEEWSVEYSFEPGEYGHFRIEDDMRFDMKVDSEFEANKVFMLKFDAQTEDIQFLMNEKFCSIYQDAIDIKIFTSEGEILTCQ